MEMRIDEHRLTLTGTGWPLTGAVRHRMMERTVTHEKPLDAAWSVAWIRGAAAAVAEHRDELTELDRAIGDGDHGINLDRGMHAAVAKLDSQDNVGGAPSPPASVFKATATSLLATVGGAAGPLLGTAFLRASRACDVDVLSSQDVATLLGEAAVGVQMRGRAEVGDKTMLDAWQPAARAAREAAAAGASPVEVLRAAANAAVDGADATYPLTALRGRASYLGARSVGHYDPGARSTALILQAAVRAAGGEEEPERLPALAGRI